MNRLQDSRLACLLKYLSWVECLAGFELLTWAAILSVSAKKMKTQDNQPILVPGVNKRLAFLEKCVSYIWTQTDFQDEEN